ncbi:hypothetical protein GY45DRAFT_1373201 [Cubamyces sp. BRFM 1775]|nr:hypothetical protein GY45DRAFT_1373201 [Cubamyces sp. BRFM 1775]
MSHGGSERTGAYSDGQYDTLGRRRRAGTPPSATIRGADDWIKRWCKSVMRIIVVTLLCPFVRAAPTLEVDTPTRPPVQCQAFEFTWRGGTPPFVFSVISAQSPQDTLEHFSGIDAGSYRWTADIVAGTQIFLQIADATGAFAETGSMSIQAGSDSSCLTSTNDPQPQPTSTPFPTDTPVQHSSTTPTTSSTASEPFDTSSASPPPSNPGSTSPTHTSAVSSGDGTISGGTSPISTNSSFHGQGQSSGTVAAPANSPTGDSFSGTGTSHLLSSSSTLQSGAAISTTSSPSTPGISGGDPSTPSPSLQSGSEHHIDTGAIIGLVCGSIAVLALVIVICLYRRRRRRRHSRTADLERSKHVGRTGPLHGSFFAQHTSVKSLTSQKHASLRKEEGKPAEQGLTDAPTKSSQPDAPANRLSVDVEPPTPLPFLTALALPSDPSTSLSSVSKDPQALPVQSSIASRSLDSFPSQTTQDTPQAPASGTSGASVTSKSSKDIQPRSGSSQCRMMEDDEVLTARRPVHDTDGGVRLAGGPVGEEMDLLDDASYSAPSLLPPPYSRY